MAVIQRLMSLLLLAGQRERHYVRRDLVKTVVKIGTFLVMG